MSGRGIARVVRARETMEGAGVRLRRSIGSRDLPDLDPFLLLDEFRSDDPEDYLPGFPTHPHRGIETVTYLVRGEVAHQDSTGNKGVIRPGEVQWMTAGGGILHSEMPSSPDGRLWGLQLWVNLPAARKMSRPRYQEFGADRFPVVGAGTGARARVIAGSLGGETGPVGEIAVAPLFLDVEIPPGGAFSCETPRDDTVFAYVLEGRVSAGSVPSALSESVGPGHLIVFGAGDAVSLHAEAADPIEGAGGARLLLVSGRPLREPIARYGPFVMNTREEIEQTLRELREGTFLDRIET